MSLLFHLHTPVIQHNNTIRSLKCSWNFFHKPGCQKQCETKVKKFGSCLRNIFESRVSGGRNKYQMKNFRDRHDRVPPYPRIKKFTLLKIAVVVSTGIYVGDVIGKSFQNTILSIRDELWYPYEE